MITAIGAFITGGAAVGLTAAAAETPTDPTGGLLSYGVLGIIFILFLIGQIVPGKTHARVEAENDRLRLLMENQVIPAIQKSNSVLEKALDMIETNAESQRK